MACVALLSLMRTLELEFLQPLPRPILQEMELLTPFNKDLVQSLLKKLGSLMELFDKNRMDGVEAIEELETKLRDVAFRVEDEIEFQIAHLHETEEDFGIGTPQGDTNILPPNLLVLVSNLVLFCNKEWKTLMPSRKKMVGRDKEFEIIMGMLIERSSRQLKVVSISGMGGIGKTTLARRIYRDPLIASSFDLLAWVNASQHQNDRQMLLGLLNSLVYTNNSSSDEDLSAQLRKTLWGQRYDQELTTHAKSYSYT
ncbi:PREDICTED: disease resistance protein RPP13-like [Ipomoea nil]|uniref:disease resistance protein RPP13-like n=1 Tax=Ipomoea nil TaxID=35883 RepID=UPI000900BDFB|nr:PREDICTED: disease resistance protein RPP13-like [Ipomoea nil]